MTLPVHTILDADRAHLLTWFEQNWRAYFHGMDVIASSAVPYAVPVGGHLTNLGDACDGVYFLFQDDELRYIGKATNVNQRIHAHWMAGRIAFNRIAWIPCVHCWCEEVEYFYIRALRPPMNAKTNGGAGYRMAELVRKACLKT